jgi:hypothetical protein
MRTLRVWAVSSVAALVGMGCVGVEGDADEAGLGQTVAEVRVVPAGVGCLRIVYRAPAATADTTRSFPVTPGTASSFDLGTLAAGMYTFRANAYGVACSGVATSTAPTWVGDPVSATITPGELTRLSFTLRPNMSTPGNVDFVQPVRALFSGLASDATYAVMQDGSVRAWGNNAWGQLGDGTQTRANTPRPIAGLTGVQQIAGGPRFACAVTSGGLACWGEMGGLLADDQPGTSLSPRYNPAIQLSGLDVAQGVLCGGSADGTVRCWSDATNLSTGPVRNAAAFALAPTGGALGSNQLWLLSGLSTLRRYEPLADTGSETMRSRVLQVALRARGYCVLIPGGEVWCAGPGSEVGDGTDTAAALTEPVRALVSNVVSLVSGEGHTCALRTDRTVACWGGNTSGQTGLDTDATRVLTPQGLPLTDVVQLAAGAMHTCALRGDGTVYCWGANYAGQLGDGTFLARFAPTRVAL